MVLKQVLAADYHLTGPGLTPGADGTAVAEKFIGQIIGVLTIFAVIWFVIQIILAGYAFISAQGDEKQMESARKRLTDGVLGVVVVVIALGLASLIATLAGAPNIFSLNTMFTQMGF